MAAFVAIAAALALATFGWVLRPLWRARPVPGLLAVVLLAAAAGLLYRLVGTPAALDPQWREPPRTMDEAIARLEAELRRDAAPETRLDGLRLLARTYLQRGQPDKARATYARALALAPDDADLLAESAESRALADPQRRFDAAALEQLQRAVRLQPTHQRARWFLGVARRQRGEHAAAAAAWEPLLAVVDPSAAAALRPQIDAARRDAGLPPLPAPQDTPAPAGAVEVRVAVDPALAQRMPGASVFVIARAPDGPPMPVAVEKHPLSGLPRTVVLDDRDSPMPTAKLSSLPQVELLARLSPSGNAMRQPGDVESPPVRIALPAKQAVELRIAAP